MKLAFSMIVFNGAYVLREALESITPYGHVYVTEGPVGYFAEKGMRTSSDQTNDILRSFETRNLCTVTHGIWREKTEMMQAQEIPPDTDFVWMVDSDEVFTKETMERMVALLETDQWDSVEFRPYSFYGGFDHYLTGYEENPPCGWHRIQRWQPTRRWHTHRPPTVLAEDGKPYREHRHMTRDQSEQLAGRMFHYSYVFPSQVKSKVAYYHSRAPRETIDNYMRRVYWPWVTGNQGVKQIIENHYNGVHDMLPSVRGECRTTPFTGRHPTVIEESMPRLKRQLRREIAAMPRPHLV